TRGGCGGAWLARGRSAGGDARARAPAKGAPDMASRVDYIAPWWTYWLHNFPHVNLSFQPVGSAFNPQDDDYQQALIFLAGVAAVCLALNLIFISIYMLCLCCCKRTEDEETKRPNSCCVTWTAVIAGLTCCAAVGVGFYGNSETNDGVYQLTYSIYNVNHTLAGVDSLVAGTMNRMKFDLKQHISRLDEIFAERIELIRSLKFMQQMADSIRAQLSGLPVWHNTNLNVAEIANNISSIEYYRWLSYLLLLIVDLIICLVSFLGLTLSVFQRSLTTMQFQIQGMLHIAVPIFPMAQKDLLQIQQLLNQSESNLHQLTALLDCRGLHKDYLDALIGVCYDGVEGLLYLSLFSILAAVSFCALICAISRAWKHIANRDRDYDDIDEADPFNPQARRIAAHNPARGQLRSFCSFSSSLGSQTSLQPPATTAIVQPTSTAPAPEYMNNTVLFGGNPRYENVPLIGRNSPPPSVRWASQGNSFL
uniref:Protein tweety homolog n=2 Tax=Callorhinchus milii TaxID=7868 RepID=A0A4W3KFZ9_CALMI